jgi:hypothetical protein
MEIIDTKTKIITLINKIAIALFVLSVISLVVFQEMPNSLRELLLKLTEFEVVVLFISGILGLVWNKNKNRDVKKFAITSLVLGSIVIVFYILLFLLGLYIVGNMPKNLSF